MPKAFVPSRAMRTRQQLRCTPTGQRSKACWLRWLLAALAAVLDLCAGSPSLDAEGNLLITVSHMHLAQRLVDINLNIRQAWRQLEERCAQSSRVGTVLGATRDRTARPHVSLVRMAMPAGVPVQRPFHSKKVGLPAPTQMCQPPPTVMDSMPDLQAEEILSLAQNEDGSEDVPHLSDLKPL